jgi:hypothetical protein
VHSARNYTNNLATWPATKAVAIAIRRCRSCCITARRLLNNLRAKQISPRLEIFAVFGDTFAVIGGLSMMGQAFPGTISRAAAVVAPGMMVMAIILFMGKVSGAHLNPAVSIAFSLRGDFPWQRVPGYIVCS